MLSSDGKMTKDGDTINLMARGINKFQVDTPPSDLGLQPQLRDQLRNEGLSKGVMPKLSDDTGCRQVSSPGPRRSALLAAPGQGETVGELSVVPVWRLKLPVENLKKLPKTFRMDAMELWSRLSASAIWGVMLTRLLAPRRFQRETSFLLVISDESPPDLNLKGPKWGTLGRAQDRASAASRNDGLG
jgi:hypothetical protein